MGYAMGLYVFKKKTLDKIIEEVGSGYSFEDIYSGALCDCLFPDRYDIPKDEEARCFYYGTRPVFDEFFGQEIEDCGEIMLDKARYNEMCSWLKEKLCSITLFSFVDDKELYEGDVCAPIIAYQSIARESIDFETEFVVFSYSY